MKQKQIKILVEKHQEGYVAYPLGLTGVVVGEGDTYEEALADVKSAIEFHMGNLWRQNVSAKIERGFINLGHILNQTQEY